jgi:hypothetical protein
MSVVVGAPSASMSSRLTTEIGSAPVVDEPLMYEPVTVISSIDSSSCAMTFCEQASPPTASAEKKTWDIHWADPGV